LRNPSVEKRRQEEKTKVRQEKMKYMKNSRECRTNFPNPVLEKECRL